MESQSEAPDTARPAASQEDRREEPQPARQAFAEPAMHESRMSAQPAVASDGQLVELGYGHGV